MENIDFWAIHPGGRAILDKLEKSLKLKPQQIQASRKILRNFGNMSSATIFFVLREIMMNMESEDAKYVCSLAFGPGLTVESGILEIVSASSEKEWK